MTDITPIVIAFVSMIFAIIGIFLIPFVKSKVGEEKFKDISKWVRIAVNAAEQIYNESGMGEVKKEYVLEFLKKRGITMDIDSVDALIESEVYKLNSSK